jgi:Glycosyl hydrolase family 26
MPAGSRAAPRVYWGAQIGSHLTGAQAPWDMSAVSKLGGTVRKQLSLVHFAAPFADCSTTPCSYFSFPTTPMTDIRAYGAIPFFSWSSQAIPSSLNQPDFQLSDVIAGRHDDHIRSFASAAKSWGRPFFMRFNWEMNGDWFQWSEGVNGNQPGEYVAAWRHVHDIFRSVGATNVSWVWCPFIDPRNRLASLGPLYPGDAYVDWTCLDGFNWGTNPNAANPGWRSFDWLFSSTYQLITQTIAPNKPMVLGEVASSEYGGSKAGWINNMFSWLPSRYPKVRGLLWFEVYIDGMDWPIVTSTSATNAFSRGIRSERYAANSYSSISRSPIPAPGG